MKWARGSKTWYTRTGPVKERIPPKLTPWVTQATLTRRVTAVVIASEKYTRYTVVSSWSL